MNVQQNYLSDIATAIREKEGSFDEIPAKTFAQRIRNLSSGASSSYYLPFDPKQVYADTRPKDWLKMR